MQLQTKAMLVGFVVFYLPHLMFFLYKVGQSIFSAASKLFIYQLVCLEVVQSNEFQQIIQATDTIDNAVNSNLTSQVAGISIDIYKSIDALIKSPTISNAVNSVAGKVSNTELSVKAITCEKLKGEVENIVQSEAGKYILAMKLIQDIPAFLLGLFCGSWMDRIGQRFPVILSLAGGIFTGILFAALQTAGSAAIPGVLVGFAINSFSGRNVLVTAAVQKYISDRTEANAERTKQLGFIMAMNYFGLFVGTFTIGLMGNKTPFWVMFSVTVFLYAICIVMVLFFIEGYSGPYKKLSSDPVENEYVVPDGDIEKQPDEIGGKDNFNGNPEENKLASNEKLEEEKIDRQNHSILAALCQIDHFTDTMKTIFKERPNHQRLYLGLVFISVFIQSMCKAATVDVLMLFVMHTPLSMTNSGYGYLLSFQYISTGVLLILVLPFLLNIAKLSDSTISTIFTIIKACSFFMQAYSTQVWMIYLAVFFSSTFGVIISCLRSIASKIAGPDESGKLFAIISSVEVIADAVGIVVFIKLYNIGLDYGNPGFPFLIGGFIHIGLLMLSVAIQFGTKPSHKDEAEKGAETIHVPVSANLSSSPSGGFLYPVGSLP